MSVRKIEYTVTAEGISPAVKQFGGVQGDHRATEIVFKIDKGLDENLKTQVKNDGGKLIYRVDGYNAEGGVVRSEPVPLDSSEVQYMLEESITRYGGLVRAVLVISMMINDTTEMDLFNFPAMLQLKNLPAGAETSGENHESMSVLAQVAKEASAVASAAAGEATEAIEEIKTKLANGEFKGEQGPQGAQGEKGDKGEQGIQGIQGIKGDKGDSGVYLGSDEPDNNANVWVDTSGEDGDSFITEEELHQVKQEILNSLNYDIFGTVNEDNNIIINAALADGTYILKYENQDGTLTEIGSLIVGEAEEIYNIIDIVGYQDNMRISSSSGTYTAMNGQVATNDIPLNEYAGQTITIRTKGVNFGAADIGAGIFAFWDGDTKIVSGYLSGAVTDITSNLFTAWNRDENGNFTSMILPVPTEYTNLSLRMSGTGLGADLIVTINKAIEY